MGSIPEVIANVSVKIRELESERDKISDALTKSQSSESRWWRIADVLSRAGQDRERKLLQDQLDAARATIEKYRAVH